MSVVGLTEEEIAIAKLAGQVFLRFKELPRAHPSDLDDVVFHVHAIQRIVLSLAGGDRSEVLELQVGERSLTIATAGADAFQVLAKLDEDAFYDLVGDRAAEGFVEVVVGGQSSELPRRHLVTKEDAQEAAGVF